MGNTLECTFIVEFVEERLELVKSLVSFHLHTTSAWYFCPMKIKSGFTMLHHPNKQLMLR